MIRPSLVMAVVCGFTLAAAPAVRAADDDKAKTEAAEKAAPAAEEPKAEDAATDFARPADEPRSEPVATEPVVEQKAAPPKAPKPSILPKVGYVVQHALMGAGVAFVALQIVVLLVTAPVLYALPRSTAFETLMPIEWRRAVSVGLVLGVVPGLLVLAVGGVAATAVSAIRNMGVLTEG